MMPVAGARPRRNRRRRARRGTSIACWTARRTFGLSNGSALHCSCPSRHRPARACGRSCRPSGGASPASAGSSSTLTQVKSMSPASKPSSAVFSSSIGKICDLVEVRLVALPVGVARERRLLLRLPFLDHVGPGAGRHRGGELAAGLLDRLLAHIMPLAVGSVLSQSGANGFLQHDDAAEACP